MRAYGVVVDARDPPPARCSGTVSGSWPAAQAAGVFGLEDGLRMAAARGAATPGEKAFEVAFRDVDFSPPACTLVSGMTGRAFGPGEVPGGTYWQRQGREPFALQACIETLAGLQVDAVLEIGPDPALGPAICEAWGAGAEGAAPPVLAGIGRPVAEPAESGGGDAFAAAVAGAYEAGLPVDWEGMFAGESRRRISLPGYPFQRRRFWIKSPKR